jgi:hypothetical protein
MVSACCHRNFSIQTLLQVKALLSKVEDVDAMIDAAPCLVQLF